MQYFLRECKNNNNNLDIKEQGIQTYSKNIERCEI